MRVRGRKWTTLLTVVSRYLGKVRNKENNTCDKRLTLSIESITPKTTGNSVMWEVILKVENLACSKMLHLQVTWENNQRQEVYIVRIRIT